MIYFGIIGSGYRSEFYLRIAALLPERFSVTGVLIRNPAKKEEFRRKYAVRICDSIEELKKTAPAFVVSCVGKHDICETIATLCRNGLAVLSETPIGTDKAQTENFKARLNPAWRVQVAEQFHFQPKNQAIKQVIDSGLLGEVHQVQLSCCHGYHAVSLARFFLGIGREFPRITSVTLPDPIRIYNSRNGTLDRPKDSVACQTVSVLVYRDKSAVLDFSDAQYFSDIRQNRVIIRGTAGEIVNDTCTYLQGTVPLRFRFHRNAGGAEENLDGLYLKSIDGNGMLLYVNPFGKARLSDEEIAIAACLTEMEEYLESGREFYSVPDASVDAETTYLQKEVTLP